MKLEPRDATETDYRIAVANAACTEVSKLCELLTESCCCVGFAEIAKRYLDPRRFMLLVLRQDAAKLDTLTAAAKSGDANIGRLLMRVGAILEGRPDTYDEMDTAAKRKATIDTQKIIAEVKTLAKMIDDGKDEIVGRIDAVGAKVDRLKPARKRKSKYSEVAREACLMYWNTEQRNVEVRHSLNTRVTYEVVFKRHARELAAHGIATVKQFQKILHAAQSRECEARPLWDFLLPLRTAGLHFVESCNTSYALRTGGGQFLANNPIDARTGLWYYTRHSKERNPSRLWDGSGNEE